MMETTKQDDDDGDVIVDDDDDDDGDDDDEEDDDCDLIYAFPVNMYFAGCQALLLTTGNINFLFCKTSFFFCEPSFFAKLVKRFFCKTCFVNLLFLQNLFLFFL